jgi:aminopeptidase
MEFKKKLENYAKLLIEYGLNVVPGQIVNVTGEIIHREFLNLLVKFAYQRGARHVNVDFVDPNLTKTRLSETQSAEHLTHVPSYIPQKFDEFVKEGAAVIRVIGSEDPDSLADQDPHKINSLSNSYMKALKNYYAEGVGKSKIQWTVAAAATPKWGKKIFPELDEQKAYEALWEEIFKITRSDKDNYLEAWKHHNDTLKMRSKKLDDLKIKELHFTGPETDLKVYLTPKARFIGGSSKGPHAEFEPNVPTEECFTTPDYRLTHGKVKVTRPVLVNGKLIKGLRMEFKEGKLVHFTADEGLENFTKYVDNDEKSRYLGEVALVGTDSPIFKSGRVFEEILYDENAACHIALGFAYSFCLEGGTTMTPEELDAVGCNKSSIHVDMMISNEHVDVHATTYDGKTIALIKKGEWVPELQE